MTGGSHLYYSSFASELLAKFRRVGHLVSHNATTGSYHEEILRSVLRNFLSKRFSVKTGFVYRSETEVSKQVDIIIVDENDASAYLYQEGNLAIVRPRSVVAAIEVKTHLDAPRFEDSLKNIASIKCLDDTEDVCGLVFGYDSPKLSEKALDKWFKRPALQEFASKPSVAPDLIAFLQEGVLLLHANERHEIADCGQFRIAVNASKVGQWPDADGEGWQLQIVLSLIYAACLGRDIVSKRNPRILGEVQEMKSLLMFAGAVAKIDHFEFGRGHVPPHRSDGDPISST